jgi:hypothetical protein
MRKPVLASTSPEPTLAIRAKRKPCRCPRGRRAGDLVPMRVWLPTSGVPRPLLVPAGACSACVETPAACQRSMSAQLRLASNCTGCSHSSKGVALRLRQRGVATSPSVRERWFRPSRPLLVLAGVLWTRLGGRSFRARLRCASRGCTRGSRPRLPAARERTAVAARRVAPMIATQRAEGSVPPAVEPGDQPPAGNDEREHVESAASLSRPREPTAAAHGARAWRPGRPGRRP